MCSHIVQYEVKVWNIEVIAGSEPKPNSDVVLSFFFDHHSAGPKWCYTGTKSLLGQSKELHTSSLIQKRTIKNWAVKGT